VVVLVVLALAGIAAWFFLRRRGAAASPTEKSLSLAATLGGGSKLTGLKLPFKAALPPAPPPPVSTSSGQTEIPAQVRKLASTIVGSSGSLLSGLFKKPLAT
jgi:hypothetical protein